MIKHFIAALRSPPVSDLFNQLVSVVKTVVFALILALLPRIVLAQPYTIPSASMEPTLQEGDYIIVSKFAYGWSRYSIPFHPPLGDERFLARAPQRGDVVVFNLPRNDSITYVKRLIGLPGDSIQVRHGLLLINSKPVKLVASAAAPTTCPQGFGEKVMADQFKETLPGGKTHFIAACLSGQGGANDTAVYHIPSNCYFMMGDNRDNSVDSRFPPTNGKDTQSALAQCPFDPKLADALHFTDDGVGFVPFQNFVGKADVILASWSHGASLFKPWTWVVKAQPNRWLRSIS